MSSRKAADKLYAAINDRDPVALLAAMTDDFEGIVSAGMPLGVGGRHKGPEAMLAEVWLPVFQSLEVTLDVERVLDAGGEDSVAIGTYRGTDRATGDSFEARFAHVLETRGDRIRRLEQITDTGSWPERGAR